ncbi:hypothetical protein [Komagataeibacter sp. FNDCR2]|uniref:hypothetical protein n=1 Tax=Komagataeibacter sp. FNDCR2 TaxID=2878682 RepID=UPI001E4EA18B|nr:hypothetical protein [Komagataeibacter sp. FNDCR2]MCE2576015.1 hypothetical protein [Komagataeibacter sp. FNDCR2]
MTDTTSSTTTATNQTATPAAAAPQNYVLYRTTQLGWQQVGYVIMAISLSSANDFTPPAGMALGLDAAGAHPAGSIYTPAPTQTPAAATNETASPATS